jgi:hypothetical protein
MVYVLIEIPGIRGESIYLGEWLSLIIGLSQSWSSLSPDVLPSRKYKHISCQFIQPAPITRVQIQLFFMCHFQSSLQFIQPFNSRSLFYYPQLKKVSRRLDSSWAYNRKWCWWWHLVKHIYNNLMKLGGSLGNVPQKLKKKTCGWDSSRWYIMIIIRLNITKKHYWLAEYIFRQIMPSSEVTIDSRLFDHFQEYNLYS